MYFPLIPFAIDGPPLASFPILLLLILLLTLLYPCRPLDEDIDLGDP